MKQFNVTHLNWSVNDENESASIVKLGPSSTGNWSASDLTEPDAWVRAMMLDFNEGGSSNGQTYYGNSRVELDFGSATCVTFASGLSNKTVQVWDNDANSSCDFRGTVSSTNSNGFRFIKVRRY